jgi:hypothetical protein
MVVVVSKTISQQIYRTVVLSRYYLKAGNTLLSGNNLNMPRLISVGDAVLLVRASLKRGYPYSQWECVEQPLIDKVLYCTITANLVATILSTS